ncbi:DUF4265 domain-containing protein [Micromonospora sp. LOL_024]|uniref:DUF4265 domain-containing protein n=1 Tax=Micromonospora sp. LOL_024 TaxID=3345412 RepID=UPI003A86A639
MVDLEPFGFPGLAEQIWLVPSVGGTYEVACIPFRVYGLALKDVVELDHAGKVIIGVRESGGHRVFRVFLSPSLPDEKFQPTRSSLIRAADEAHLKAEWSGERHLAVDVPPQGDIGSLWSAIEQGNSGGGIYCEWGDVEMFRR